MYKNKVQDSPGWNDQILGWCLEAAKEKQLRKEDYWGGLVLDEMKIQVIQDTSETIFLFSQVYIA